MISKSSPITGGPTELHTAPESVVYRGETIQYEKSYYRCVESGMEFVDEALENENLKQIYDTYRRNHAIPLAEDLTAWRESCGIPASAMSIILGLGENQFGLYEDGVMPTPSVGKFLTLAMEPGKLLMMLQSSRTSFTEKQFKKYYDAIVASLPPAEYKSGSVGVLDYEDVAIRPAAEIETGENSASSPRKSLYSSYLTPAYAIA